MTVTGEVAALDRLRKGVARLDAVKAAVRCLFAALLASTVTTALSFTPLILLPGGAGDFVGSIAVALVELRLICSDLAQLQRAGDAARRIMASLARDPVVGHRHNRTGPRCQCDHAAQRRTCQHRARVHSARCAAPRGVKTGSSRI